MGDASSTPGSWQDIAAQKTASNLAKIPAEWRLPAEVTAKVSTSSPTGVLDLPRKSGILTDAEVDITESYTATELVRRIASGQYSAAAVTEAFCKRAAIAQQLVNCLTEIFFDQARERAKFLDTYLAEQGKPIGPLHGLPISLKDGFDIKGIPSTLGFISFTKRPLPEKNSAIVDVLLSLGAVLYVKTNIPQTLMAADSDNNLFGRTLNPQKLSLTPGGSSGGEGALVALRGSLIGVGTDIAGSVRIPALCCGVYGLKSGVGRVPMGGATSASRSGPPPGVIASAGPLTTSAEDLYLFLSTVLGEGKPWDVDGGALCAPWRHVYKRARPLHLGLILEDAEVPVSAPILRALNEAGDRLKAAGHKITILREFPSLQSAATLCWRFFDSDPKRTSFKHIQDGGEPLTTCVQRTLEKVARYSGASGPPSRLEMDEFYDINTRRLQLQQEWNRILVQNGFDAIILPGNTTPAPPHETYENSAYTSLFNMIDYPSSIIPFLHADKSVDKADPRIPHYDPEAEDGAPCALQLFTRAQQEEELTEVTQIVAEVLHKSG